MYQQHLNEVIGSGYSNSKACILCGLYFLEELMKDIIKLIKYTDISYMKRQIGCADLGCVFCDGLADDFVG